MPMIAAKSSPLLTIAAELCGTIRYPLINAPRSLAYRALMHQLGMSGISDPPACGVITVRDIGCDAIPFLDIRDGTPPCARRSGGSWSVPS